MMAGHPRQKTPRRRGALLVRIGAGVALLALLAPGAPERDSPRPKNESQLVETRPLGAREADATLDGNGELSFVRGWEMTSRNSDFGAYSGLLALGDDRFLAISDAAVLMGFTLAEDGTARDTFIAPLPEARNSKLTKEDKDTESFAHDPATGRFWVATEHHHAIRRYARSFSRMEAEVRPDAMKKWPKNGGAEGLVRLPDGRFLVFAEAAGAGPGRSRVLLYPDDPVTPGVEPQLLAYRQIPGYRLTDAALLPDGRIITVNRRFTMWEGVSARIAIVDVPVLTPGTVLEPRVVARLEPPFPVDNMEGIAVTQEGDRTFVWLISDDNFNPVQRTLLLKFELEARPGD